MKNCVVIYCVLALVFSGVEMSAQEPVKKKVKEKTEKKADEKIDKTLDKGFTKLEGLFKRKKKDDAKEPVKQEVKTTEQPGQVQSVQPKSEEAKALHASQPVLRWAQYDFVPGERIIFEDVHEQEENGEFPSRWDLHRGAAENATFDGSPVIFFRSSSTCIIPYLKNSSEDYLPDRFTLEFDVWFDKADYGAYYVRLYDDKNQSSLSLDALRIRMNEMHLGSSTVRYPGASSAGRGEHDRWRHVSISFNKRSLKAYLDETRLLNIPNLGVDPTGITICSDQFPASSIGKRFMKNVRLAEGAVKLYDRIMSDGKIVSNGIRFDVNQATLRPESMGVINEIYQMMVDHPDLKFSIEGHTDSDGETDFNLQLSLRRAETVRNTLTEMGIDSERLSCKGFGETIPVASNNTPEGKATNRRVEFVKI
jgi:outer membrane protein OmpA-like peptidoglycan-associated protein